MSSPQDKVNVSAVGIPGLETLNGSQALSGEQLMSVLQKLGITSPVLNKLAGEGGTINDKDAAQTLSNLAQAGQLHIPLGLPGVPGAPEPGPSSHPRGPPNLGQGGPSGPMNLPPAPIRGGPGPQQPQPPQPPKEDIPEPIEHSSPSSEPSKLPNNVRQRGTGRAAMGTDEWARQRKDNHKEVERRRRGNINEGINELGRIVPNGSGEKSKGAILSRAVQYIHHLKENEARNIEKWTLEKLLMDQAMGDLQSQLEEVRKLWEAERSIRQRMEGELEALRGGDDAKRKAEDSDNDRDGKRPRTD